MVQKFIITGSLAYDSITVFNDHFKNHILPEKIHQISLSFTTDEFKQEFGGTAGNIAYNISLLGESPSIHATAGNDFTNYNKWLQENNIDTSCITIVPNKNTAAAHITTDIADNQISSFAIGAMAMADSNPLVNIPKESLVIISPNQKEAFLQHAKYCQENNIPYILDPGQTMPILSGEDLKQSARGSLLLILNDYEWELWKEKTGLHDAATLELTKNIIITQGEKGSRILSRQTIQETNKDSPLSKTLSEAEGTRGDVPRSGTEGSREGLNGILIPAVKNIPIVDPTGSGDAYRGGLMVGLSQNKTLQESAELGTILASFCIGAKGTQNHHPTPDQISMRLHQTFTKNPNQSDPARTRLARQEEATSSTITPSTTEKPQTMENGASTYPNNQNTPQSITIPIMQNTTNYSLPTTHSSTASSIKDPALAEQGRMNIEFAEAHMGALMEIRKQFEQTKPFNNMTIGMALHVTKETAVLVRTLKAGGARVVITGCNPLSTQDDVAAALALDGDAEVHAHKGESTEEYYEFLKKVIAAKPDITIDDGCDLVTEIHNNHPHLIPSIIGGCEETTTGIIRLNAMEKDGALKYPVIAVNDNKTKHLMDNYYGTGQSTLDGIIRSTNILFAGKTVVVIGYGSCGKGVAMRAKGLGANVVVTEIDNFCALQAKMDGFRVLPLLEIASEGDIFITVTGNLHVIDKHHMEQMKDGAIMANSGHFDNEINLEALKEGSMTIRRIRHYLDEYSMQDGKKLFVAGEGRLVNLASAEGHPSEVMSLSFCGQALACKYLVDYRGTLPNKVIQMPPEIDDYIASLQLKAMNTNIDQLTPEQLDYLNSWQHGT